MLITLYCVMFQDGARCRFPSQEGRESNTEGLPQRQIPTAKGNGLAVEYLNSYFEIGFIALHVQTVNKQQQTAPVVHSSSWQQQFGPREVKPWK